jgi:hypothetical protein
MWAETDLNEYLAEIRKEVCSRCVERPEGGPPCGPLGKPCGIELHLPMLLDAIHEVRSDLIAPYLDHNRSKVCPACPFLNSSFCPCPMESLVVLLVEAVEAVDARREHREQIVKAEALAEPLPDLTEIARIYGAATGAWKGCDWSTAFGAGRLNLKGAPASWAETKAACTAGSSEGDEWTSAACWLTSVEKAAAQAESEAGLAMRAAMNDDWSGAFVHARRAWALEVSTGRPLRHFPPTWQPLYQALRLVAAAHRPARELAVIEQE